MDALLGPRETDRLRLEPWSAAHAVALVDANADPAVMRFVGGGATMTADEAIAQSRRFTRHWEDFGFGLWATREKATSTTIGFVGLSHPLWLPDLETEVEVGWRLLRAAWGRGLATEAGHEAIRAAFEELRVPEVISIIRPGNLASLRVAHKLGLLLRESLPHPTLGDPLHVLACASASGAEPPR